MVNTRRSTKTPKKSGGRKTVGTGPHGAPSQPRAIKARLGQKQKTTASSGETNQYGVRTKGLFSAKVSDSPTESTVQETPSALLFPSFKRRPRSGGVGTLMANLSGSNYPEAKGSVSGAALSHQDKERPIGADPVKRGPRSGSPTVPLHPAEDLGTSVTPTPIACPINDPTLLETANVGSESPQGGSKEAIRKSQNVNPLGSFYKPSIDNVGVSADKSNKEQDVADNAVRETSSDKVQEVEPNVADKEINVTNSISQPNIGVNASIPNVGRDEGLNAMKNVGTPDVEKLTTTVDDLEVPVEKEQPTTVNVTAGNKVPCEEQVMSTVAANDAESSDKVQATTAAAEDVVVLSKDQTINSATAREDEATNTEHMGNNVQVADEGIKNVEASGKEQDAEKDCAQKSNHKRASVPKEKSVPSKRRKLRKVTECSTAIMKEQATTTKHQKRKHQGDSADVRETPQKRQRSDKTGPAEVGLFTESGRVDPTLVVPDSV